MAESSVNRWNEDGFINCSEWLPPKRLFGPPSMVDINDFEETHYNYFLDHVSSWEDLIAGLEALSPLADDALTVAKKMGYPGFKEFRAIIRDRNKMESEPEIADKFRVILLPSKFLTATIIAEKYQVCLGAALVRLMELTESPPS